MGPRQKCLGNIVKKCCVEKRLAASMGPRQKCLGNPDSACRTIATMSLLQWGRDKNVSEIVERKVNNLTKWVLQWGRDKNVSEIYSSGAPPAPRTYASMGPRQKCLGNKILLGFSELSERCFNGAETKMSRKFAMESAFETLSESFNGAETKMSRKLVVRNLKNS